MRAVSTSFFAGLTLVFCTSLAAQQPTAASTTQPPQRDAQALQLLNAAYGAIGGAQRPSISDVLLQGTLASPSAPQTAIGSFVAKARGLDFSIETTVQEHHKIYRVLAGVGSITVDGNTKGLPTYNTYGLSLDLFPIFARWTEFANAADTALFVGLQNSNGAPCNMVHVESPDPTDASEANDHGKVDVCIDAASGLVDSIQYRETEGGYTHSRATIQIVYSGYRNFGQLYVPTTVVRYIEGKPAMVFQVSQVQLNNGFSDSDFRN